MATFFAKLKRTSTIHIGWRQASRNRGLVANVPFSYKHGEYVSEELKTADVEQLRPLSAVILEMISRPAPVQVAPAPEAPRPQSREEVPVLHLRRRGR